MKSLRHALGVAAVASLLFAPGALADDEKTASEKPTSHPEMKQHDEKASTPDVDVQKSVQRSRGVRTVLDADVTDASGKKVGEVEDAVIDLAASSVTHLVVDYEGSAFTDGGKVMISWTTAQYGGSGDDATVVLSTAQLDMAEPFEEDAWRERVGDHQALVSEVMDDEVTRAGEEVGNVHDVLVDDTGALAFLSLEVDDDLDVARGESAEAAGNASAADAASHDEDAPVLVAWSKVKVLPAEDRVELTAEASLMGARSAPAKKVRS